ncbi:MAG: bifunctional nuclease family protein [Thermoprotei archaeon]|nr:MAG: hypothetical protein B6U76_01685 [Desulfurococcales archaeon ex4484_217_2]RLG73539.1 MAG: bifunctional nuclease family protein [Thermoprotei archaeon]
MGKMVRVVKIEAFLMPTPPYTPVISCHLEDGRQFNLYYVPYEIVIAINRIQGEDYEVDRESLFDVLPMIAGELKDALKSRVRAVYIDGLNRKTMLYSATMEIKVNGAIIKRKMIPSHAIYLALLTNSEVYVAEELVKHQEELSRTQR